MKIFFFKSKEGKSPPSEFLKSLPTKIEARFRFYLKHLQEAEGKMQGIMFRKIHGYPLEEIRVKESRRLHRVLIKIKLSDCIIVLHGFTKKEGQATPKKELEIAYQRWLIISGEGIKSERKKKK